jgi:hypothetical protein
MRVELEDSSITKNAATKEIWGSIRQGAILGWLQKDLWQGHFFGPLSKRRDSGPIFGKRTDRSCHTCRFRSLLVRHQGDKQNLLEAVARL